MPSSPSRSASSSRWCRWRTSTPGPDRSPPLVGRNTEQSEAGLPILRHQDQDLYFREHVDRIGIGYYGHRPMPVDMSTLMADTAGEPMPSMLPFTEEDFAPAWRRAAELLPALGDAKVEEAFNGIFSFTPDGFSIMGEHRDLQRVLGRRGGVGDPLRGRGQGDGRVDRRRRARRSTCTNATCTGSRTSARSPEFILQTSSQAFVEVYDIIHPLPVP